MKWYKKVLAALLGLVLVSCMVVVVSEVSSSGQGDPVSSTPDLKSRVWDMGAYIKVLNRDTFTWTNVRLELNTGLVTDGYTVKVGSIGPGEILKVGAARFTKSGGERFNPFTHEPVNFGIWADQGYHYGEW